MDSGRRGICLVEEKAAVEKDKTGLSDTKIQPLDCLIDLQPSDQYDKVTGPRGEASELGCQLGLDIFNESPSRNFKRLGNLGFEYFKGPNPEGIKSAGLSGRVLDQVAGHIGDFGKLGSSSAAGPLPLTQEDLDFSPCHLNQIGSPPSTQFNFQPKNFISINLWPHEDTDNSNSEVSNYFDHYHSDGNFLDDSDWYSEDSESAKFLKGKWRRSYTLRANVSRRSLGSEAESRFISHC